eukprot:3171235-Prymnesium_polylepis.1
MTVIISNATRAAADIASRMTTGINCTVLCQRLLRTMILTPSIGDLDIAVIAAFVRWFHAAATFQISMEHSCMILALCDACMAGGGKKKPFPIGGLLSNLHTSGSACPAICADLFRFQWTEINMR